MSTERKEGILIATISIVALLILALLTEWESYGRKLDFSEANIQFDGFKTSCEYQHRVDFVTGKRIEIERSIYSSDLDSHGCKPDGTKYIFGFILYFKTILIFALPIFSYGLLRAFGIIRRLFPFEEKLFKYVEEKKKDNLLTTPPPDTPRPQSESDEASQPPKKKHWSEKDLDI